MSFDFGFPVEADDLNGMTSGAIEDIRSDNAALPGIVELSATFPGLVTSTPVYCRKQRIVIPCDMLVESLCVATGPATSGASTITVLVTGDGALPNFAMKVTGTLNVGRLKQNRLLFDNTLLANQDVTPELTSRVMRLLPKGSTIFVTVETTNALNTMQAQVLIAGRSFLARETM